MLLSRVPVLDKGFVAKVDSSMPAEKLNEIAETYHKRLDGGFLSFDTASLTVLMKCPLFVQLNLSTFNLQIKSLPLDSESLEVYLPSVGEIGGRSLQVNTDIAEDMKRSSVALLMNHSAYQADGCDKFISQILTPINTYTTILVHGMYNDWGRYTGQANAPAPIAAYIAAVHQILRAEWR
jgi:hypothetical protein